MAKPFSQRYGYVKVEEVIQVSDLDDETRRAIWNCLYVTFFDNSNFSNYAVNCAKMVWTYHFNFDADKIPSYDKDYPPRASLLTTIKKYIYACEWFHLFDLIEFLVENTSLLSKVALDKYLNHVFRKFGVGYTIINGLVTPVSDEVEIESVQKAIDNNIESSKYHLQRALELLSDREQPDFRNSIKESISAIESLCRKITGDDKGTLGKLIKVVEEKGYIHQSMKNAFSSLYGYTSDTGGIRHSLTDAGENPTLEDARYMLVICSAFSNYLISKMGD
ncbi:hypothetical protein GTGU_03574 [Trabulsiella guamensis ATCC 49490]|uniref:HEPN AbiJ-N-terminal domain-containing protein n=1 Tax=Trabulsiella guamensis ATCC 49490 TaxID=1005994 RepID=A0A084ZUB2_9ENTR|nr:hypothetical protein [Trabulsiella guamensis]KFC01057.1 hypothetical protein GTGU_03574 [Trabulsiella guamensis ATCC 49490]